MESDSKAKVMEWLNEMNLQWTEADDPGASWRLDVVYPHRSPNRIAIVQPKGLPSSVVVACGGPVPADNVKVFAELDDSQKADCLWDLRFAMLKEHAEFNLHGMKSETDLPNVIEASATRYMDGLSLDEFARSISVVYKTFLAGVWTLQKNLGARGFGLGGRFDFRRVGM